MSIPSSPTWPTLTTAEVRAALAALLRHESDLSAVCLDYFPLVYRDFAGGQTRGQLDRVLTSYPPLLDELKYWRTSPVKSQAPLDRAVLRAALLLRQRNEPASAAAIRQQLQATGTHIPAEDYRQSLDRLELGYLLIPEAPAESASANPGPRGLRCPVPLIAAAVAEDQVQDFAAGIAEDLTELAASSA